MFTLIEFIKYFLFFLYIFIMFYHLYFHHIYKPHNLEINKIIKRKQFKEIFI